MKSTIYISQKHSMFGGCEYGVCLNADSKACGCAIDMVDGASETLDLTLSKRNMIEFSSNVIGR